MGMKVVFVSSDRDQEAFDEYYKEMPWLALPYENRAAKDALSKQFKVQGIPSLVMLDASGALITDKARGKLDSPDDYPWVPPTLTEIMQDAKIIGKDGPVEADDLVGKPMGIYFSDMFGVQGIPSFVVVDGTGNV